MKNIQKITAIGLCVTMLAGAAALAETADTASSATPQTPNVATAEQQNQLPSDFGGQMPQGMPGMNNQNQGPMNFSGQMPQDMPGMNNQNQAPADFNGELPALPEDADSDAERPALPDGTTPSGELPALPEGTDSDSERPALPDGTAPSGELPALPEGADSDSERPALPDGTAPSGELPALPDGTAPADQNNQQLPAMPGMGGQNQGGFGQMTVHTGNNGGLLMRREASQDSKILGVYANGTQVDVLEAADGEWVKVQIGNRTGYMMIKFLDDETPTDEAADLTLTDETAQN